METSLNYNFFNTTTHLIVPKVEEKPIRIVKKIRRKNFTMFKTFVRRIRKIEIPKMKLGCMASKAIEDFLSHVMAIFDEELQSLSYLSKSHTLTVRQLETVMKLCLPKYLAVVTRDFGRKAVDAYFKNMKRAGKMK